MKLPENIGHVFIEFYKKESKKLLISKNITRFVKSIGDNIMFNKNDNLSYSAYSLNQKESEEKIKLEFEKTKKINDELNSPIYQRLNKLISQNKQQIDLLETQTENLKRQLEEAIKNEHEAKLNSKKDRIIAFVSLIIGVVSLIASILIAIFK